MSPQASITQVPGPAQAEAWSALQRELEQFLNTQRRSLLREEARMALWANDAKGAWRRLDRLAVAQASTPPWLHELQNRIRPLLEVQG